MRIASKKVHRFLTEIQSGLNFKIINGGKKFPVESITTRRERLYRLGNGILNQMLKPVQIMRTRTLKRV